MSTHETTNVIPLYAGFWRRAAACIDSFVLVMTGVAVTLVIQGDVLQQLVNVIVGCAYHAGFHSSRLQATLGKRVFGIKVTDHRGLRIGVGRAIGRCFCELAVVFPRMPRQVAVFPCATIQRPHLADS